jgi:hypothetical protein
MNRPKLTSQDDAGLRKLAGAMLVRALEDLNEGDDETRAEAWRWLGGRTEAGLNFYLCCKILGCHPGAVRRGLLRGYVPQESLLDSAPVPVETTELVSQLAS